MESLYHTTNRSLAECHQGFLRCESPNLTSAEISQIQRELQRRLETILSNCERLDILVQKEPVTRRQNAKIRVDQLKYDVMHLQASIRNLQAKQNQRQMEERSREELLSRRFTTNAESAGAVGGSETSILIDKALDHNNALGRSNKGVDDLLNHGAAILENLRDQRYTIKGFHKKMLDVASTLGMSSTVMRLIERRQEGDKYVLIGGMVITCIVMYVVIRYFT